MSGFALSNQVDVDSPPASENTTFSLNQFEKKLNRERLQTAVHITEYFMQISDNGDDDNDGVGQKGEGGEMTIKLP